eukprot:PhF_6_TR29348/c0_g1_i1/m.43119
MPTGPLSLPTNVIQVTPTSYSLLPYGGSARVRAVMPVIMVVMIALNIFLAFYFSSGPNAPKAAMIGPLAVVVFLVIIMIFYIVKHGWVSTTVFDFSSPGNAQLHVTSQHMYSCCVSDRQRNIYQSEIAQFTLQLVPARRYIPYWVLSVRTVRNEVVPLGMFQGVGGNPPADWQFFLGRHMPGVS